MLMTFRLYHSLPSFCWPLLALLMFQSCWAFAKPLSVDALKVAYIYNIARFTSWPTDTWTVANAPFYFCYYGQSSVNSELVTLENKTINGHSVNIFKPEHEDEFQLCHALYLNSGERHRYRYLLSLINQATVLVISDNSPFFMLGGMINLIEKEQRLRFQVNKQQLDNSQLKFSSKLLKLAIMIDNSR